MAKRQVIVFLDAQDHQVVVVEDDANGVLVLEVDGDMDVEDLPLGRMLNGGQWTDGVEVLAQIPTMRERVLEFIEQSSTVGAAHTQIRDALSLTKDELKPHLDSLRNMRRILWDSDARRYFWFDGRGSGADFRERG